MDYDNGSLSALSIINEIKKYNIIIGRYCSLGQYLSFKSKTTLVLFWLELVVVEEPWKSCEIAKMVVVRLSFIFY